MCIRDSPEVAEIPFPEGRLHPIRASCVPSQDSFGGSWGNMISEFREFIPVVPMPLGTTMNPPIQGYSYGVSTSIAPLGTLDCLLYTSDAADERSSVDL